MKKHFFELSLLAALSLASAVFYACNDDSPKPSNTEQTNPTDTTDTTIPIDPTAILGCMDEKATNYNKLATIDDKSCVYAPTPIYGCMDASATNYNPDATNDDESCVYATPDGVKIGNTTWATRNVDDFGTFAANPQDAGKFYQLNRKTAWNATETEVTSWEKTTFPDTTWEKANDPCPIGWKIPTRAQLQELVNVGSTWSANYNGTGVVGRIFGSGNNILFLPAAGFRWWGNGSLDYVGTRGYYWGSTEDDGSNVNLTFGSSDTFAYNVGPTPGASFVRCVAE